MKKTFELRTERKYKEELQDLNEKLNPVGFSFSVSASESGNCLNIEEDEEQYLKAMRRNAGRKPHALKTSDIEELRSRVEEVGVKQVADEEGVSEKTIRRRLKKWM